MIFYPKIACTSFLDVPCGEAYAVSSAFRETEMTEEAMQIVQEICRPDLEIYNYAKEKFWVAPGSKNE